MRVPLASALRALLDPGSRYAIFMLQTFYIDIAEKIPVPIFYSRTQLEKNHKGSSDCSVPEPSM
ncbi:hypothetical protein KDW_11120 [Dictyobacter vulcani]|uniref:Uncharacterized protein n=1 Tax=Dictyobacter vulcani TaxID=2607529 RepID=A0A5J4KKM3_9CHLR|nr:hypothetical protein KDW_11120 [Dictyobacter vulcani]